MRVNIYNIIEISLYRFHKNNEFQIFNVLELKLFSTYSLILSDDTL